MKGLAFFAFVALLTYCTGLPSVLRFEVENKGQRGGRLGTYKFTNCLPADKELMVINSLSLMPDPLVFPGPLDVSFNVTAKAKVQAPLKTVVYLGKRVGSTWIKIPCIGQIGSCTYDDLCELLSGISQCPDPFVKAGVPCQCPYDKGAYVLPKASFDVETALFPPGDYHGQANLTMNGQVVGCYDIMATFG